MVYLQWMISFESYNEQIVRITSGCLGAGVNDDGAGIVRKKWLLSQVFSYVYAMEYYFMKSEDLVKVTKFNVIGEDNRGVTADFSLPRGQAEFVFITRKANSLSGNTYHEGKYPATKPKIFILLSGIILLSYRKIGTDKKFSIKLDYLGTIEISPFVRHKVEVITDCILLEGNSVSDIQSDRIKEEV